MTTLVEIVTSEDLLLIGVDKHGVSLLQKGGQEKITVSWTVVVEMVKTHHTDRLQRATRKREGSGR